MATKLETYDTSTPGRPTILHDPHADLDYSLDLSKWLQAAGGDTIVSAIMILETPLIPGSKPVAWDDITVTGWVTGGTVGKTHRVTFRFTTAAGRIDDRSVFLKVQER